MRSSSLSWDDEQVTESPLTTDVRIGDVVKSRMSELEFERDQLDHYVHTSQT